MRAMTMRTLRASTFRGGYWLLLAGACVLLVACNKGEKAAGKGKTFPTPEAAAESLVAAAERWDVPALTAILGPSGVDLVLTDDQVQDRNQAQAFATQARTKTSLVKDSADSNLVHLVVGSEDWPLPIPLVQDGGAWRFDTEAGREEVLVRRIGSNELDAIEVCRGYVEAQKEYALTKHDSSMVNQYAQRVFSTPGKHDGLAWQDPDSTWQGPVGEEIARAIAEGYKPRMNPYHGYYFKILKGQGPAAPMGEIDFVVKGAMIGGFALAATPAEYGVTGIKTFMVSHDGIVYEKDMGEDSMKQFETLERYNPDSTWKPVAEQSEAEPT